MWVRPDWAISLADRVQQDVTDAERRARDRANQLALPGDGYHQADQPRRNQVDQKRGRPVERRSRVAEGIEREYREKERKRDREQARHPDYETIPETGVPGSH